MAKPANQDRIAALAPDRAGGQQRTVCAARNAAIVAVAHRKADDMPPAANRALGKPGAVLYGICGNCGNSGADLRL